jgi:hypothetical protein
VPAEARTSFPAQGGPGTQPATIECGDNEYLVGFSGRVGSWVDQLQPLCATISHDGRRGPINYDIRSAGGNGGSPAEFSCPSDSFISSTQASITRDKQVYGIDFTCYRPLDGQYLSQTHFFGGTAVLYFETMAKEACPSGEIGTGVNIRYGKHVNAFGLVCDTLVIPAPPVVASPPPPPPQEPESTSPPGATTLVFQGTWQTVNSSGQRFGMVFNMRPFTTLGAGTPIEFDGTFTSTDGARQRNGTFQARGVYPMASLNVQYVQPGIESTGTIVFVLAEDGESFTGEGLHNGTEAFVWNGARNATPPTPPAPAGAATTAETDAPTEPGSTFEENTDRPGHDYSQTVVEDAESCQAKCQSHTTCVAWTWVRPGWQGDKAQCYLKDRVPSPRPGECCTSGTVTR